MSNLLLPFLLHALGKADNAAMIQAGYGDGSDGAITGDFTVQLGAHDTQTAIINAAYIDLPAGATITTSHRAKGLIIYCQGDCTIAGTINMNAKAGMCTGAALEYYSYNQLLGTVARGGKGGAGGAGGAGGSYSGYAGGTGGAAGAAGSTGNLFGGGPGGGGGGGGGGANSGAGTAGSAGGVGTPDTAFGTAAGGIGCGGNGGQGGSNGAGGAGACPGGGGGGGGYSYSEDGTEDGAAGLVSTAPGGGTIVLVVGGNLTITSTGSITANGGNGGNGGAGGRSYSTYTNSYYRGAGGGGGGSGGMGGGVVVLVYNGIYTNNGSIAVSAGIGGTGGAAGVGGTGTPVAGSNGAAGTAGSITTYQI